MVALSLLSVFGAGVSASQLTHLPGLPDFSPVTRAVGGQSHHTTLRRSTPTRISIPSLGVRARIIEVGRSGDGSVAAPATDAAGDAGWYSAGPSPGEAGSALVVGHVDTADKPAIFHSLRDLRKGKFIEVKRQDRRVATFTVDAVKSFPKTSFPIDEVYAAAAKPRLILVTCGGRWVGGSVGYADNVIVFATLV